MLPAEKRDLDFASVGAPPRRTLFETRRNPEGQVERGEGVLRSATNAMGQLAVLVRSPPLLPTETRFERAGGALYSNAEGPLQGALARTRLYLGVLVEHTDNTLDPWTDAGNAESERLREQGDPNARHLRRIADHGVGHRGSDGWPAEGATFAFGDRRSFHLVWGALEEALSLLLTKMFAGFEEAIAAVVSPVGHRMAADSVLALAKVCLVLKEPLLASRTLVALGRIYSGNRGRDQASSKPERDGPSKFPIPHFRCGFVAAHLPFLLPALQIWPANLAADVDVLALPHEHVSRGCDIRNRSFSRVHPRDPVRNRNVVRGSAIAHRDGSFYDQQQLRPTIVVGLKRPVDQLGYLRKHYHSITYYIPLSWETRTRRPSRFGPHQHRPDPPLDTVEVTHA